MKAVTVFAPLHLATRTSAVFFLTSFRRSHNGRTSLSHREISDSHTETASRLAKVLLFFLVIISNSALSTPQIKISESPLSTKIQQPTITAIFKDHNGYLWIGTQHGLYKFDGVRLSKFGSDMGGKSWIPVSYVNRIVEDTNGRVIIGAIGGGLLAWNSVTNSFQTPPGLNTAKTTHISELVISKNGDIWAGTRDGLLLYKFSQTSTIYSPQNEYTELGLSSEISAMVADLKDGIYFASGMNLYHVPAGSNSVKKMHWLDETEERNDRITALALDKNNHIFIGTDGGYLVSMDLLDPGHRAQLELSSMSPNSVSALLFYKNMLWIGTNNGLSYSDQSLSFLETFLEENSGLSNSQVTSLFGGNELIWVGTYSGINTISFVPFEIFDQENSGVFNDVLAFEEDTSTNLWIGTFNGLYLLDKERGRHIYFQDLPHSGELHDYRIMTMSTSENELWLGFQKNGLQIVNTDTLAVTTPPIENLKMLEVTKILHTDDNRIWIATFNKGLIRLENENFKSYLSEGNLPETSITVLFEPKSGGMIASSEHKIYQHQESVDQFQPLDLKFGDANETPLILSISQNDIGDVWVGTKDQGLFIWKEIDQLNGVLNLRKSEDDAEFSFSTVYGIQFDTDGSAWCSTQSGIVKLDSNGHFLSRFNASDGLQGPDFNFGASFRESNGRIYFGGSNGYNRFVPREIETRGTPPELLITQIAISGDGNIEYFDATTLQTIQLTHKDYFVQFDFSVLDFLDPEKNQYRYMLEGFDPKWIENGTRNSATYTSLPPGDYTLRVQGANSAGIWNREGLSLDIEVLPPPWRTWWAYSSYALLLLFIGWLGKRAYDSSVVKRRAEEMAVAMVEADERADDEMQEQLEIHDDLVKSVYRHSVSTLNLVSEVIALKGSWLSEDNAREMTEGNIRRVAALALLEDCLYYQNELLLADLNKYTDIIISRLLKDSPIDEETITTINEVSSRALSFEQASPLAIALYELLENAIQHAFEGAPGAHYLHVVLVDEYGDQPGTDYHLTVQDNGLGIPSNIDPLSALTPGLAIVSSMVQRLSGELNYTMDNGTSATISFHCLDT